MGLVDLVFLVEGSDVLNEIFFRMVLDIVKDVCNCFFVFLQDIYVVVVVYGINIQIEFNFRDYYNISKINEVLKLVLKFIGVILVGKVLSVVKNNVYDLDGRIIEFGVICVFLYIMCSKLFDDVIVLVRVLKEFGVRIVVVGFCFEFSKVDLCNIGSFLLCSNFVFICIFKFFVVFGKELVDKLKEGQ